MPETAEARCRRCEATVIVFASAVFGAAPDAEAEFLAHAHEIVSEEGKRFGVADEEGRWTCPSCGASNVAAGLDVA